MPGWGAIGHWREGQAANQRQGIYHYRKCHTRYIGAHRAVVVDRRVAFGAGASARADEGVPWRVVAQQRHVSLLGRGGAAGGVVAVAPAHGALHSFQQAGRSGVGPSASAAAGGRHLCVAACVQQVNAILRMHSRVTGRGTSAAVQDSDAVGARLGSWAREHCACNVTTRAHIHLAHPTHTQPRSFRTWSCKSSLPWWPAELWLPRPRICRTYSSAHASYNASTAGVASAKTCPVLRLPPVDCTAGGG